MGGAAVANDLALRDGPQAALALRANRHDRDPAGLRQAR